MGACASCIWGHARRCQWAPSAAFARQNASATPVATKRPPVAAKRSTTRAEHYSWTTPAVAPAIPGRLRHRQPQIVLVSTRFNGNTVPGPRMHDATREDATNCYVCRHQHGDPWPNARGLHQTLRRKTLGRTPAIQGPNARRLHHTRTPTASSNTATQSSKHAALESRGCEKLLNVSA